MEKGKTKSDCIACLEPINTGAKICPHCQSPQTGQSWKAITKLFSWIGGITAIVALIIGVKQLNDIVANAQERISAVNQYTEAAKLQMQFSDFPGAWYLVGKGLELDPSSNKA